MAKATHGMSGRRTGKKHPVYCTWISMKTRCLNPNYDHFNNYGGRGIQVCNRWLKFENFMEDMLPSWKPALQLDRIDVNGNYEPSNCRWVTVSENAKNRRNKAEQQSNIPGVSYCKKSKKWTVTIRFKNQTEAENFANVTQENNYGLTRP